MAYTAADLANIEEAIVKLAMGARVVRVTIGDKLIEYGQAQLPELQELRDQMKNEMQAASGRKQFVLTKTSKGL